MTIRNNTEKWVFIFFVSLVSVGGSLLLTWIAAPDGLNPDSLVPAIGVPLMIAPVVSLWFAGMMLRIQELNRQLEHLVRHDQMTSLLTRRAFFDNFEELGMKNSGSILVADIDRFKTINDTYGHQIGDRVIREVASILKARSKPDGFAARFGGEEFVSFYPGECIQHAEIRAETIRAAVESQTIQVSGRELSFTLSIGVEFFDGSRPLDQVLHAADEALYEAKREGRNRVVRQTAQSDDNETR
ncbi:GGDEF domain-containing protein [Roseibium marinum]|uniref:diguanylate cyclase n=1 Tax=Roseibium marinum TaxID=281252 RepID=A0A2S3UL27_9HYPH|nr:GGDEF domain-containing protein [Roseibium marinum]POF28414.1 diguanylate cyclase (GGDEF)-like protein [Roseibium marinum]